MRWPLVLLASCIQLNPAQPVHPDGIETAACHLGSAYDGTLSWPGLTDFTQVYCIAQNEHGAPREICFRPYVGVRETGAFYTTHDDVCTEEVPDGGSQILAVQLDMKRSLCNLDRGGCVVRALTIPWPKPVDAATVVAMARGLEAQATMPGRDRPTVAECEALVPLAPANPDETIAMCLNLTRAELACLSAAPDPKAAQACAPRMP
jgi:hypothetical protein